MVSMRHEARARQLQMQEVLAPGPVQRHKQVQTLKTPEEHSGLSDGAHTQVDLTPNDTNAAF